MIVSPLRGESRGKELTEQQDMVIIAEDCSVKRGAAIAAAL